MTTPRRNDEERAREPSVPPLPGPVARRAWQGLAVLCIGLGGIGAVLPLVPTTVFILGAAYAASRSSPRLHAWLYAHPRFGPILRDWREHRALRPRAKRTALLLLAASWLIMMLTVESDGPRWIGSGVIAAVAVFLATRPEGPPGGPAD